MMKNSKLSKLLVAGVSVAVLASAVAPMAFAEETSSSTEATVLTVHFNAKGGKMNEAEADPATHTGWKTVAIPFDKNTIKNAVINLEELYTPEDYQYVTGYNISFCDVSILDTLSKNYKTISVDELLKRAGTTVDAVVDDNINDIIDIDVQLADYDKVTVEYKDDSDLGSGTGTWKLSENNKGIVWNSFADPDDKAKENSTALNVKIGSTLTLPEFALNDKGVGGTTEIYFAGYQVSVGGTPLSKYNGTTTFYSADAKTFTVDDETFDKGDAITITPVIKSVEMVTLKLNTADIDASTTDPKHPAFKKISGKTLEDITILNTYPVTASPANLKTSEKVILPTVTTSTTGWTFAYWEIPATTTVKLSNGSQVSGYKFENNVFDPSVFDYSVNSFTLNPVFVKGTVADPTITYSPAAKTPNDKISKYADGKFVETKTWADFNNFQGGLFYNEADGTVSYYLNKNSSGKFVVDTTVNGLVDGIVFDKGVQDTKACGLYKVSDKDTFSYLVSDGVYKDDYQGLWCDEDGTWYYLIDGCCQTAAKGVYEHTNGWFYNFVDGKMVETNGFQMHGTDFYWFVKGECKPEGGADCVEWDGDLYYIEGGKFVPTFNDTFKGSVFVNGVCDK